MPNRYLKLLVIFQLAITTQTFCKSTTKTLILKKEHCKSALNIQYQSGLAKIEKANTTEAFRASLFLLNSDNSVHIADGIYIQYGSNFSNSVDITDAMKLTNINENFAIERDNVLLAIERRQIISSTDTLFFNLTRTTKRNYQFGFTPEQLNHPGLIAILQDSYLKTNTPINLETSTKVNFNINSDPESAAPKRFRVVFRTSVLAPMPFVFTSIKGIHENNNINISWTAANQLNTKKYEIEKSLDGKQFSAIASLTAVQPSFDLYNYQWADTKYLDGSNYYRIRAVDINDKSLNSDIIKVVFSNSKSLIKIYPNPVVNGNVNLQLTNQPSGIYSIKLFNNTGQLLFIKQMAHNIGSNVETFQIDKFFGKGKYHLEVISPDKTITSLNVLY